MRVPDQYANDPEAELVLRSFAAVAGELEYTCKLRDLPAEAPKPTR